jgi:NadR type nicotinamide-nucleotide adenylyltransferase
MIRISVTGPESTGKSWLAEHLAEHYKTKWVPEYARKYLEEINRPYTYQDILVIAQKQWDQENSAASNTELLFCDTDFCVTNIWCKVKYGKCHEWITEKLEQNNYGLYLLCDIDLPWQYDPLREHPEMRSELFGMYCDLLQEHRFNYRVVTGTGEERLQNAIFFVDEYLQSNRQIKFADLKT